MRLTLVLLCCISGKTSYSHFAIVQFIRDSKAWIVGGVGHGGSYLQYYVIAGECTHTLSGSGYLHNAQYLKWN